MQGFFMTTTDEVTAALLRKAGFQEVGVSYGSYTFLTSDNIQFSSDIDRNKIQYTNTLCI